MNEVCEPRYHCFLTWPKSEIDGVFKYRAQHTAFPFSISEYKITLLKIFCSLGKVKVRSSLVKHFSLISSLTLVPRLTLPAPGRPLCNSQKVNDSLILEESSLALLRSLHASLFGIRRQDGMLFLWYTFYL